MGFESAIEVRAEFARRGLPAHFCHMPFTTLVLQADGTVACCRTKGSEHIVGDLRHQTIREIWNGPEMQAWRRDLLEGPGAHCAREQREKACHLCPDYNALLPLVPEKKDGKHELKIRRLALNLNGQCNLRCRMCDIWKHPNGFYLKPGLWEQIEELLPGLREIEMFSGEPFIQKQTWQIMARILAINPSIEWSISTNAHWSLNDGMRAKLDPLRFKNLFLSVDSVNPGTYRKIRGGDLSRVLANIRKLVAYGQDRLQRNLTPLNPKLCFLIQKDNWSELPEMFAFARETGLPLYWIFLYLPDEFSLLTLPDDERDRIVDFYLGSLSPDQVARSMRVILPLLDSLVQPARQYHWLHLKEVLGSRKVEAVGE